MSDSTGRPNRKAVALAKELKHLILDAQKKEKPPKGMAKCPACGAILEPMKIGRIRTHESDPMDHVRCPASGKPWSSFGKLAPNVADKPATAAKAAKPKPAKPKQPKTGAHPSKATRASAVAPQRPSKRATSSRPPKR